MGRVSPRRLGVGSSQRNRGEEGSSAAGGGWAKQSAKIVNFFSKSLMQNEMM